jgi:exodeoxyribonuclease VII small subunit
MSKKDPLARFDERLKELEEIVERLDSGDLPLEDSLAIFEEGIKLVRELTAELEKAEKKIELLTTNENGTTARKSFEANTDGKENDKSG